MQIIAKDWIMRKFWRITTLMAIFSFDIANAEQSGGFIGLEVGYGFVNTESNINASFVGGAIGQKWVGELNGGGVDAGFTAGYKQFFGNYFGLRYYVNVNATYALLKTNLMTNTQILQDIYTNKQYSALLINYGANIDMLINFVSSGANDFGMFVGASVGGNNWSGSAIDEVENFISIRQHANITQGIDWKMQRNFLDVAINAGLRTNIATNHGLELGVRIPLLNNVFMNKERTNNIGNIQIQSNTKKPAYKHGISAVFRYTYTFGSARKTTSNPRQNMRQQPMRRPMNPQQLNRQQPQTRQPMNQQYNQQLLKRQQQMRQMMGR